MRTHHQSLARFWRDDEGTITIFSAIMLILILAITGASVDLMRRESERVRLQVTLDRAVLAAADLDQGRDPESVVTDYVAKAGLAQQMTGVTATADPGARVVSATADMDFMTLFLPMIGYPTLPIHSRSTAEERIANVEISMVLDISGSMRWNNRIETLRPAASRFVEKVLTEDSAGVTTLNLIPFAGQVNPGTTMFDYFRGKRDKIKHANNGWGNGDQDAPGNSLCSNNAENADEALLDPACGGDPLAETGLVRAWDAPIGNIVFYFDTNGDDIYDRAHRVGSLPANAPRDADDFFGGWVAYLIANDWRLSGFDQFLGFSIKGSSGRAEYFQVKGDLNGPLNDLGPTKNTGRIPGRSYAWADVDYTLWAAAYVPPVAPPEEVNVNIPSSCVEIHDAEFATTALPLSEDYVPHFQYWPAALEDMDWGWCPGEDTAIQYYSDNAAALVDFINNMRLHDGTGLQYGMKYALALLDPATAPAVDTLIDEGLVDGRFEGRPIAWRDPETEKFIVVMTDGMVTDQVRPSDPTAPVNGYIDLQTQGAGSYTMLSRQANNLDNLFSQCQQARDLGVTVFVVAYETTPEAARELSNCASSASHFFDVDGEDLIDAFDVIARQINNLRLIQ
ncbi:TadE/TadG family type IV pilus assembly protein [Sagittula salina]|uniref:Pilus assembly protein n=1 Tax=Sagittula salina TaxID=2820268 RepID=A0A940S2G1_9RHOB|nr:TadE/TadG family type IV pilus assembly protein [Sagittula salina]MBP0484056.1 pilus assembly protein [Sagittula salina]